MIGVMYHGTVNKGTTNSIYRLQSIEVEITLRCPLRCMHCSVNGGDEKVDIPLDKFKEIVDDCAKIGVEVMDIIGGEPLAHPEIFEALKYASEKIPSVFLNTAGYFIGDKIIERLKDTGISGVFISLDGADPEKHEKIRGPGTFIKTCKVIEKISKAGFYTIVSFVAHAENYRDLPRMLELCENLGAKKLYMLALIPEGRGKNIKDMTLNDEMIKQIFDDIKSYSGQIEIEVDCSLKTYFGDLPDACSICPAGTTFATIKYNGDVFPCGFLREYEYFKAGNIYEDRLYDIWRRNERFSYFRKPIAGCASCEIYRECRGGCQAVKRGKACGSDVEKRKKLLQDIRYRD